MFLSAFSITFGACVGLGCGLVALTLVGVAVSGVLRAVKADKVRRP